MKNAFQRLPGPVMEMHGFMILRDLDIYMTETLVRRCRAGAAADYTVLACALTGRVLGNSHVCLDFKEVSPEWLASLAEGYSLDAAGLPDSVRDLARNLREASARDLAGDSNGLIGGPDSPSPIVLSGTRLYLRRYWMLEAGTALRLRVMSADTTALADLPQLKEQDQLGLNSLQEKAASAAMRKRLTVISGGPGTGKTYTAGRILYLLLQKGIHDGKIPLIRLAAPTGKAAANLDTSVKKAMADIPGACGHGAGTPESACTIERLLGYRKDSPYFRYNSDNRLNADVVLIDEASMIDLPKMARLLEALQDNCRLILLGDMHQLASVAPGSVMADICESNTLKSCVVELEESRRFPDGSPVHRLGQAVNAAKDEKDSRAAWDLLKTLDDQKHNGSQPGQAGRDTRITLCNVPELLEGRDGNIHAGFAASVARGFSDFMKTRIDPAAAFEALGRFRILCALRHGPHGSLTVNRLVENILAGRARQENNRSCELKGPRCLDISGEFYDHRVIMVTRNDYALELFNGDTGIILPDPSTPGGLTAWFEGRTPDAPPRPVPCSLLPEHETAFAVTIHKAQGSEFDRILVMLPGQASRILTKELVYTAITRTRGAVELWTTEEVFKSSVITRISRSSGLLQQLDQQEIPL